MSLDELWDILKKESEAALGAKEAGKAVALYKITTQRRVIGVLNVESHDELDGILMSALPMAHYPELEKILPVRPYEDFAGDVKRRWS